MAAITSLLFLFSRGDHLLVTVDLRAVSVGTELNIVQEGVPEIIPAEACLVGWQQSLELLARLVEAHTSG